MSSGNATGTSARFGSKTIRASPLATAKRRVSKPRAIGPATCVIGSALAWPHARCSTQQCWSRQRWLGGIRRFSSCRAALRGAPLQRSSGVEASNAMFSSVLVPSLIGISQGFWYLFCTDEAWMHPPGTQRQARLYFAGSYCRIKRCSGLLWNPGLGVHSPGQEAKEILDVFYNCGQCILAETF